MLDRPTAPARRRHAEAMFLGRPPRRLDGWLASLYFNVSAREWSRRGRTDQHLAPFTAGLERCRRPERVLDLGCGAGATTARIAARFPEAEVRGVDGAARMISVAQEQHTARNLSFVCARFEALPFADRTFDLVSLLNALPHPVELDRVTTPDAEVLIANTYFESMPPALLVRLENVGFYRVAGGDLRRGSWQLLRRRTPEDSAVGPPPVDRAA